MKNGQKLANNSGLRLSDGYRYIGKQIRNGWEQYGGKICTIAGTTGLIFTGIHACRKTYKIHDELKENGRKISEARKDKTGDKKGSKFWRTVKTSVACGMKTSRHYLPDLAVGVVSGAAVAKGWQHEHNHYQQAAAMVGVVMADFMN